MYLGEPSLSNLWQFLDGYESALFDHAIPFERVGLWRETMRELPRFHDWVRHRFHFASNFSYHQAILKHTNGDEVAALSLFWGLLDEYRALESAIDGVVLPDEE